MKIDLEKYIAQLKERGVDPKEVETELKKLIVSNVSVLSPRAE